MKCLAVIIRTPQRARVAEALRAALGLMLRGDEVLVVLADAARAATTSQDPAIDRALATLQTLGHLVLVGDAHIAPALRKAHAVEVWT